MPVVLGDPQRFHVPAAHRLGHLGLLLEPQVEALHVLKDVDGILIWPLFELPRRALREDRHHAVPVLSTDCLRVVLDVIDDGRLPADRALHDHCVRAPLASSLTLLFGCLPGRERGVLEEALHVVHIEQRGEARRHDDNRNSATLRSPALARRTKLALLRLVPPIPRVFALTPVALTVASLRVVRGRAPPILCALSLAAVQQTARGLLDAKLLQLATVAQLILELLHVAAALEAPLVRAHLLLAVRMKRLLGLVCTPALVRVVLFPQARQQLQHRIEVLARAHQHAVAVDHRARLCEHSRGAHGAQPDQIHPRSTGSCATCAHHACGALQLNLIVCSDLTLEVLL
mmetsp:Transcript_2215/g.8813  ORF Transcript_2215/g.8813 Transcript_2215/m.8813 type:complete len:345 (-) Transcript_2215:302-1336(-)